MINEYEKQANDFLAKTGAKIEVKFDHFGKHFDNDTEERDIYNVTLSRGKRSYNFKFGQSINSTLKSIKPNAYDILSCLQKYDPGLFEDFCSDFGYDEDSRKAEKIYNAVRNEYLNLAKMFNDDELAEMAKINQGIK